MNAKTADVTIVIPAKNEAETLPALLSKIKSDLPKYKVVVVDDGSTDDTAAIAKKHGARVISLPYSLGNGGAVKTGVRSVETRRLVLMDADGQHSPEDIPKLLEGLDKGFNMVIGARGRESQANFGRATANSVYNRLAGWMVGRSIPDLTSGFRAAETEKFKEFLYLLPNGFSYPTTITMAFFRAGYSVDFVPITAGRRESASHINPLKDGVRFLLIIFRVGTLYSPLKIFFPLSVAFFLMGTAYYIYTYALLNRFTNMGAVLFVTSLLIFLIGLVSEQVTNLLYSRRND